MGQLFCCGKVNNNNNPMNSEAIMQLNRYKISNKNRIGKVPLVHFDTNNLKEILLSKNFKYNMIYYDINKDESIIIEKKLERIKNLIGMSELNLNNNLYICGNSYLDPESLQGSFLFQLDPINPETNILPNSKYTHYYPALISIQDKYIYCIGGKNQFHCEMYDINENKWSSLPNLPEERYLCTLSYDKLNNIVYLFGGLNEKNKIHKNKLSIEYDYLLRLKDDINIGLNWEKIIVKNNKYLLNRISSGSLFLGGQENNIYIFGGKDEQSNLLDDIIKYNIENQTFHELNKKLDFPTEFLNQYPIKSNLDNFLYIFLDRFNKPININMSNLIEVSLDEIKI